jgi:hypothetical protein
MKDVQTLPGAVFDPDHDLLVAKIEESHKVPKGQTKMECGEVICPKIELQDTLEEKLSAIECEGVNMEVQWNNIKKCVLDTMSWLQKSEETYKAIDYTGNDQRKR